MRTTVTIDDDLIDNAAAYTGIKEKSALVSHALQTLVQLEAGRRLALLGGSTPGFQAGPRKRYFDQE